PLLAFEPPGQLRAGERVEQADIGDRDRRLVDAAHGSLRHAALLAIEADDEPCRDDHAELVNAADAAGDAAPRVLLLLCLHERLLVGALDADEHADEIRVAHKPKHFPVIGEVDRCLGGEHERVAVPFLPCDQLGKALTAFLLPIRLSSTKSRWPRQPSSYSVSSSASICAGVLVRGMRPYNSMTSQNSHRNGQPREDCTVG